MPFVKLVFSIDPFLFFFLLCLVFSTMQLRCFILLYFLVDFSFLDSDSILNHLVAKET